MVDCLLNYLYYYTTPFSSSFYHSNSVDFGSSKVNLWGEMKLDRSVCRTRIPIRVHLPDEWVTALTNRAIQVVNRFLLSKPNEWKQEVNLLSPSSTPCWKYKLENLYLWNISPAHVESLSFKRLALVLEESENEKEKKKTKRFVFGQILLFRDIA